MSDPIIRRFKINGLYGYKDVEIEFADRLRILIAGNGSGKTTILNSMHAFLKGRFHRLQSLDFKSIECEFNSLFSAVKLEKSDISAIPVKHFERIGQLARHANLDENKLQDFIWNVYEPGKILALRMHPTVRSLWTSLPIDYPEIGKQLDEIYISIKAAQPDIITNIAMQIAGAVGDADIEYMPTYRRIEIPLLSKRGSMRREATYAQRRGLVGDEELPEMQHINFGLADVEARLAELTENVERVSNLEYRNISATIIDEALADSIGWGSTSMENLPDIESLNRFLSRVSRESRTDHRLVYRQELRSDDPSERRIAAIEKLYESGEIRNEKQRLLRYFLSRIGSVIEKTQKTERMLQRFVDACNSYLLESSDEKVLTYDPNLMRVAAVGSWTGKVIPLSQLSSGEKQIVSILAKLYLYENAKFILIDEPELSLSIAWQRRILPDMLNSESVCQLLAITHSPFVFDNELDPFAGSLTVTRHVVET